MQRFGACAAGRRTALVLVLSACLGAQATPSSPHRRMDARQVEAATVACTISGSQAADVLEGTSGRDVLCGEGGDDVLSGGGGDDVILGGDGADVVTGGEGSDQLVGEDGADTITGGDGADLIRGGSGDDRLKGGHGRDEVRGEHGADHVNGGLGRDRIFGGAGTDQLTGRDRQPYDRADGGTGTNLCVMDSSDNRRGCNHPLDPSHYQSVPILMYHVIAQPSSSTPLAYLWVAPRAFAAQMRWLAHHHYHVVTLQEVYDYWHGAPLPTRPVVVSLDDGFRNHLTNAMPILDRHGWEGTLNLALSHYHQRGWGLGPRAIRRLLKHDWELDSHTMTHVALPGLTPTALAYQVSHSRRVLRRLFHVPVNFFCYPAGAYDSRVIGAVRAAGYQGATSTEDGLARWNDPWTLDRVRINNGDGVTGLVNHLRALGLPA